MHYDAGMPLSNGRLPAAGALLLWWLRSLWPLCLRHARCARCARLAPASRLSLCVCTDRRRPQKRPAMRCPADGARRHAASDVLLALPAAQEMASRGLAAVYDMADEATRKALLDSLVATLSGGLFSIGKSLETLWYLARRDSADGRSAGGRRHWYAAAVLALRRPRVPGLPSLPHCCGGPSAGAPQKRRAVKLSGESQLFEAGQLGSAPGGGGLTTYKELCSLATELGQPDLGEGCRAGIGTDESACEWVDVAGAGRRAWGVGASVGADLFLASRCLPAAPARQLRTCAHCARSLPLHGDRQQPGGHEQQPRRRVWVSSGKGWGVRGGVVVQCGPVLVSEARGVRVLAVRVLPRLERLVCWCARPPACRRFASIAKLAGEQLGPHVTRMLPRLYRYLYDPNGKARPACAVLPGLPLLSGRLATDPCENSGSRAWGKPPAVGSLAGMLSPPASEQSACGEDALLPCSAPCLVPAEREPAERAWVRGCALQVRDAMSHIWHALLDDPKAAVTQNFDGGSGATLSAVARRLSEPPRGTPLPAFWALVAEWMTPT